MDIIGLFDKSGAQVVSICGTLKDSVGVKNSYRYRGYRYDTETGLYYLQSRYYNSEWGRFINADGILGQTGELLGHNLFAYCKNNVVNGKDPSGFRPVYTQGEETDAMRASSYKVMNTAARNNGSSSYSTKKQDGDAVKAIGTAAVKGTIGVGADKIAAVAASGIETGKVYHDSGAFGLTIGRFEEKNVAGAVTKDLVKKGAASTLLGVAISGITNVSEYGWTSGALGRTGIDAGFIVAGTILILAFPEAGIPLLIGVLAGEEVGARAVKRMTYGDDFWSN